MKNIKNNYLMPKIGKMGENFIKILGQRGRVKKCSLFEIGLRNIDKPLYFFYLKYNIFPMWQGGFNLNYRINGLFRNGALSVF